ncbi:DUF2442 domain-containing protein [Chlorobium phaeobacteroides]|jgi:hypothetical protein|nr:DUF2442 domain-containing protein [Chlorobium phaeobacteroides]MBV5328109.1 DUF2442 domain-containing protein [Chlorobium sp.]
MDCISIIDVRYVKEYQIFLIFNTGKIGDVDLRDLVYKNPISEPLRKPEAFLQLHLDCWPTLAWDSGFDVDPESLYFRATGKSLWETKAS